MSGLAVLIVTCVLYVKTGDRVLPRITLALCLAYETGRPSNWMAFWRAVRDEWRRYDVASRCGRDASDEFRYDHWLQDASVKGNVHRHLER